MLSGTESAELRDSLHPFPAPIFGSCLLDQGRIRSATGTFVLAWRVVNPRSGGRVVRALRFLVYSLPGLIILLVVPLVIGALIFGRSD